MRLFLALVMTLVSSMSLAMTNEWVFPSNVSVSTAFTYDLEIVADYYNDMIKKWEYTCSTNFSSSPSAHQKGIGYRLTETPLAPNGSQKRGHLTCEIMTLNY